MSHSSQFLRGSEFFVNDEDKPKQHLIRELQELREERAALGRKVGELKEAQRLLMERLRFEKGISEFYSEFVSLPAHEVDRKIVLLLKRLVELLGHDRTSLRQYVAKTSHLLVTHSWALEGIRQPPEILPNDEVPYVIERLLSGKLFLFSRLDELPREAHVDRKWFESLGQKSALAIPLRSNGTVIGGLTFASFGSEKQWSHPLIRRLELFGEIVGNSLRSKWAEAELSRARAAEKGLTEKLESKNTCIRHTITSIDRNTKMVGQSVAIRKVLRLAEQVAGTDATVLIQGETGTGKELLARAIHEISPRRHRPMVTVNCSALPSTLIESELFGHERGAYTGACSKEIGRFELADGSTLFLDEIGDLAYELQTRLLRALQEGRFERIGSSKTIQVDTRVIAATNRDLAKAVKAGRFRKDLYYRLNVFPIVMPPLRWRAEDIPELVWSFVRECEKKMDKKVDKILPTTMQALQNYPWPGNIRELKNVVERGMIMSTASTLNVPVPDDWSCDECEAMTLEEMEKSHILKVLSTTGGRVKGSSGAAQILGMNPSTLFSRMRKLGIRQLH